MSALLNIMKKELKELLTPASVISIVVVAMLFVAMGTAIGGEVEKISKPSAVGIIDADDGIYSDYTIQYIESFYQNMYNMSVEESKEYVLTLDPTIYGDNDKIYSELTDKNLFSAFSINSDFSKNIENKKQAEIKAYFGSVNTSMIGGASSAINNQILAYVNSNLSSKILSEDYEVLPEDMAFVKNPVGNYTSVTYINGVAYDNIDPAAISAALSSQSMFIPIVIMLIIVMIGSIVIGSMGNEKENKTLETLLTLPVDRTVIVTGKLLAAAITGLVFGGIYMVGLYVYTANLTVGSSINLADYGLSLTALDWVLIVVSIFLAIMCALGICMILGAFAKNYKSAQTMTMPISILAIIPMFVMMFSSFTALPSVIQGVVFAIPFSHPMMIMQNLMFGNETLVIAGLIYEAIFALVIIAITVKLYKSDILITGLSIEEFKRLVFRK